MSDSRWRSERGAALVFTALALTALTGFLIFVIDQGVLMVARNQAQNAADAGAIAGAVALTFDEVASPPGVASDIASQAALANSIWDGVPAVDTPIFDPCPSGTPNSCVRVNVYRDTAHNNPIPVIFGSIFGITSQQVRATATAESSPSNATACERPFALPDTGLTIADFGSGLLLTPESPTASGAGMYRIIDVWAGAATSAQEAIHQCPASSLAIGDVLPPAASGIADDAAGIVAGLQDLFALDPDARWDAPTMRVLDSCASTHTCQTYDPAGAVVPDPTAALSPRVMALPLFDPSTPLGDPVAIVNHVAFFLEDYPSVDPMTSQPRIQGRIVTMFGQIKPGVAVPSFDTAFLRTIRLVR